MPCCASVKWLAVWLFAALFVVATPGFAASDASVKSAEIRGGNDGYELYASIALNPNTTLEDALQKGIALHFIVEVEVSRPRNWWLSWWFNENIGDASRRMRVYYNFLLRRYVVDAGYVTKTTGTLDNALAIMGNISGWRVLDADALKPGQRYVARLRVRLDTTQLAKPLQINALANAKWGLESAWYEWSFDAPAIARATPLLP
jgi:hypothetical protein